METGCVAARKESEIASLLQGLNSESKRLMELTVRLAQVLEPIRSSIPKTEAKNEKVPNNFSPIGQNIHSRMREVSMSCDLLGEILETIQI